MEAQRLRAIEMADVAPEDLTNARSMLTQAQRWRENFMQLFELWHFHTDAAGERANILRELVHEAEDELGDAVDYLADALEWQVHPETRNDIPPEGHFREYRIEYADNVGAISKRDIFVMGVDDSGEHIDAWCYLRNAERQFRCGRIMNCVDLRTGWPVANIARHHAQL